MDFPKIREEIHNDSFLNPLMETLQTDPTTLLDYLLRDGLVFFKGRLMLGSSSVLIPTLLAEFHESILVGHSRYTTTY